MSAMRVRRMLVVLLLGCFPAIFPEAGLGAPPVAVDQVSGVISLKNAMTFMVDAEARLGVREVSSPRSNDRFRPLAGGTPWDAGGALWLRLSLFRSSPGAARGQERSSLRLDLGRDAPAARMYWAEKLNVEGEVGQWRELASSRGGIFILPDPEFLPMTVYVRLESLPTLWFDPILSKGVPGGMEQEQSWPLLLRAFLALALMICLIRGGMKNGEWRLWAAAVLACAFVYAMYGDNGVERRMILPGLAPQLLAPGLALLLMPHLGRYLLNNGAPGALDKALVALSLPGALAALLPLAPGLGWLARLLPLAPLALLPSLLLTLFVLPSRPDKGLRYALCLLFPLAGGLAALGGLWGIIALPFRDMGPQLASFGYLLGGLVMAGMSDPAVKEKKDFFPLDSYLGEISAASEDLARVLPRREQEGVAEDGLEWSEEMKILPAAESSPPSSSFPPVSSALSALSSPEEVLELTEASGSVPRRPPGAGGEEKSPEEDAGAAPPGERLLYVHDEEEPGLVLIRPAAPPESPAAPARKQAGERRPVFNLSDLVRSIHEQALPPAESRGITLSWFVAPSLPLFYQGNEEKLARSILFLVRGSVEAAEGGAVRLMVREGKEEGAGRPRFSLLEVAMNIEQMRHPSQWMNQAWEAACASEFVFSVYFAPDQGTTFAFTLDCAPSREPERGASPALPASPPLPPPLLPSVPPLRSPPPASVGEGRAKAGKPASGREAPRPAPEDFLPPLREYVVLLDPAASGRRLVRRQMEGLPHKPLEAGGAGEAVKACAAQPVGLLIVDADMPEEELREALEHIRAADQAAGGRITPVLALLSHKSQAEGMFRLGCAECQVKFTGRPEFQEAVLRLCPHPERPPFLEAGGTSRPDSPAWEEGLMPLHPEQEEAALGNARRPSMLDMIVHSLDDLGREEPEGKELDAWRAALPEGRRKAPAQAIAGEKNDFMYAEMVPSIPGLLKTFRVGLRDLREAAAADDLERLEVAASLMVRQGASFGLPPLARMAVCVAEAARSGDAEAAGELAEELAARVRRYLDSLELTHKRYEA